MTPVEFKRLTTELKAVALARENLELRIMEAQENIKRLEDNIAIQLAKEAELQAKIDAEMASK